MNPVHIRGISKKDSYFTGEAEFGDKARLWD